MAFALPHRKSRAFTDALALLPSPDAFATAKAYLSNGITSEQALNAKAKIVQRGKDGVFSEEQVTELLELANKKAGT